MLGRTPLFLILLLALSFLVVVPANAQTTANLWIDSTGGTCTRQSSPGAYVQAQGCASMQAAQAAAQAGDTVIIKNGTYGAQNLASSQKTSAVSYYAETGGSVLLTGTLTIYIDHIHIKGVISAGSQNTRQGIDIEGGTSFTDILIDGFHGAWLFNNSSGVTIQNSEFGDADECTQPQEDATRLWSSSSGLPSNFKFLHNVVHDWYKHNTGCDSNHVDGFQVYAGASNVTFDGNKFYNNDTSNLMTEGISGSWVIQNNYFGPPVHGGNNLVVGRGNCSGVVVQNNVIEFGDFNNTGDSSNGCTGTGGIYRNNIMTQSLSSCDTGAGPTPTYDHNIFVPSGGSTCGTVFKRCTPQWLNGTPSAANGHDIRLAASDTCAQGAGNPTNYSANDFYGTKRPQGAGPDAGPFEILSVGSIVAAPSGLMATVQ